MNSAQPGSPRHLAEVFFSQFRMATTQQIRHRVKRLGMLVALAFAAWAVVALLVHAVARLSHREHPPQWYNSRTDPSKGLVVIVPGWLRGPADMKDVASVVAENPRYRDFAIRLWGYDNERFSNEDPENLATRLIAEIDRIGGNSAPEIVLLGHSLGGLITRRAYLDAAVAAKPWAARVSRIVLLAAPNRGSTATTRSRLLWLGDAFARSVGLGRLIESVYRGAPFVVNLRIEWIRRWPTLPHPPRVTQLIGGKDTEVAEADSSDILQFPNATQRVIATSSHESILSAKESGPVLASLLAEPELRQQPAAVDERCEPPSGAAAAVAAARPPRRVVKVLLAHGIRDYGERFESMAELLQAEAGSANVELITEAPRYEYFSALQFINPVSRRLKVYEFADMYTELLARAPVTADIRFVGHSFGTYLMGKAAQVYKQVTFSRVYLAGSVLPQNYLSDTRVLDEKKIYAVRNDVALADLPVGFLCSAIRRLGLANDIGTAGFDGFTGDTRGALDQVRYFDGGHGIAVEDRVNRKTIARWILADPESHDYNASKIKADVREGYKNATDTAAAMTLIHEEPSNQYKLLSRFAPAFFLLLLAGIACMAIVSQRPLVVLAEVAMLAWLLGVI